MHSATVAAKVLKKIDLCVGLYSIQQQRRGSKRWGTGVRELQFSDRELQISDREILVLNVSIVLQIFLKIWSPKIQGPKIVGSKIEER